MPTREASLKRWQLWSILAGIAAVGAASVVGLVIVGRQRERLQHQQTAIVQARNDQIRELHTGAVRSCQSRHQLAVAQQQLAFVDVVAITNGIKQTQLALRGPAAQLPGIRAILVASLHSSQHLIALSHHAAALAKAADCTRVAPLPKVP